MGKEEGKDVDNGLGSEIKAFDPGLLSARCQRVAH
jgi:hypothetical protein